MAERVKTITLLEKEYRVRCMCECEEEEYRKQKEAEETERKNKRLLRLRKHSLMDDRFSECNLENWDDKKGNEKLKRIATRYVDKWRELYENNIGLLIYGAQGTGKTWAANTIANEIISRYREPVIAISSIGLLARIKETYAKYGGEAEADVINKLKNASLLIIDDLGAEQKTEWATSMLYQIIDSRYRSAKPLFITTNLSLDQLRDKLTLNDGVDRTYDRIVEVCQSIEISGVSIRATEAAKKRERLVRILK